MMWDLDPNVEAPFRCYGDALLPEIWASVVGCDNYLVSNRGRIRHKRAGSPILRGSIDRDGYRRVRLNGRTLRFHRVVAEAFHGPCPDGCECAHLDGDKTNNAADNLAWMSHSENNAHKLLHGTHQAGANHPRAKLTDGQVATIRAAEGATTRWLAAKFGVAQSTIVRIRKGDRW